MRKMSLFKIACTVFLFSFLLFTSRGFSQTTPTILINGQSVMASNVSGSPYWLSSGQTLAIGNLVKFISVLEYTIAPAEAGGNSLQFQNVISVTTSQTVPANKAWKVESVAIDPTAAVFGGDNLGNHVASTNLTMGNNRIVTLGNPVALADAVNASTAQNGNLIYAADAGTADAYVVNLATAPSAYVTGMIINFKAANSNTGSIASTLNVNSLGVKTIKKQGGGSDLAGSDIVSGQMVTVVYDGTNFQIVGQLGNASGGTPHGKQRFTSNGTFTVPAGVTTVYLTMTGGGGSGGGCGGGSDGGGGGGSASAFYYPVSVTPLANISVTVGTGGTGVTGTVNGNNGTASSFGALFTTNGGEKGYYGSFGSGGTGTSGAVTGGNGGPGNNSYGGHGGGSVLGSGGYGRYNSGGGAASGYGGGGAGAGGNSGSTSGAGSPGIVIVEW